MKKCISSWRLGPKKKCPRSRGTPGGVILAGGTSAVSQGDTEHHVDSMHVQEIESNWLL
jgi:hypothetical protein